MSGRNVKQQINIMFCVKIGKNAIEKLTLQRKSSFQRVRKTTTVIDFTMRYIEVQHDVHDDARNMQFK